MAGEERQAVRGSNGGAAVKLSSGVLTGEGGAAGGVEAVAAISAVTAGDVIVGVLRRGARRDVVHLFVSSFKA